MIDEQESLSSGRNRVFSENLIDEFKRSPPLGTGLNEASEMGDKFNPYQFRSEKHQQSIYDDLSCDYEMPESMQSHC
jgi:hypothetical protein